MEILDGIHRIDAEVGGRPLYLYLFLGERNAASRRGLRVDRRGVRRSRTSRRSGSGRLISTCS